MSGSQEIRDNRMNVGLFRHWITEWQSENDNKLPSEILAEAVLDTDQITDFQTDSSMELDQNDGEETRNLKRKYKNLESKWLRLELEKEALKLSEDKKRRAQGAHVSLVTYLVTKFNRYFKIVTDPIFKVYEIIHEEGEKSHLERTTAQAKLVFKKYKVENQDGKKVPFYDIWEEHTNNEWKDRASDTPGDSGQHVLNLATNQTIDPLWKLLAISKGTGTLNEIPYIFSDKFVYTDEKGEETKVNWQCKDKMSSIPSGLSHRPYWANDGDRKETPVKYAKWTDEFLPAAVQACKKFWPEEQLKWDFENPMYETFSGGKKSKAQKAFRDVMNKCQGMHEMIGNARMVHCCNQTKLCIFFPKEYSFMQEMLANSELFPDKPISFDDWAEKALAAEQADDAPAADLALISAQDSDENSAGNGADNGADNCAEDSAATHEPSTPPAQEAETRSVKEVLVDLLMENEQPMKVDELVAVISDRGLPYLPGKTPEKTVASELNKMVKNGDKRIKKVGANLFQYVGPAPVTPPS